MKRLPVLFVLLWIGKFSIAQDSTKYVKKVKMVKQERQVCFNMTPLAAQFVPFNSINPLTTGPVNIGLKLFVNNVAYRFGAGVNLANFDDPNENIHLNIRNGIEIRKKINDKWNYSHGCDAVLSLGNLNLPGNTQANSDILIGVAPFWGVEYMIGKNLSISTETSLLIGISEGDFGATPRLQFIPPIALFLNIKH